jgi:hypothetical protein
MKGVIIIEKSENEEAKLKNQMFTQYSLQKINSQIAIEKIIGDKIKIYFNNFSILFFSKFSKIQYKITKFDIIINQCQF